MGSETQNGGGFDVLLRPHLDRLYRLAYRLTLSKPEAEDLFQDVLAKAFDRLQELVSIEEPGSWLCRVMYNHFIDKRRRFARRQLVAVDEAHLPGQSIDNLAGDSDPALDAERRQNAVLLEKLLARLGEEHRLVLLLHDVEGYKLSEIQNFTGTPIGTLKSRLHRARARLREMLDADGTFYLPASCKPVREEETDDMPATQ